MIMNQYIPWIVEQLFSLKHTQFLDRTELRVILLWLLSCTLNAIWLLFKEVKRGWQHDVTYTLCGSNVHVAADEGQAVVHAHLQINHPETKQHGSERKLCLQPFCLFSCCLNTVWNQNISYVTRADNNLHPAPPNLWSINELLDRIIRNSLWSLLIKHLNPK